MDSIQFIHKSSGCRVENPAGGTFIELKNGRAKKVLIP